MNDDQRLSLSQHEMNKGAAAELEWVLKEWTGAPPSAVFAHRCAALTHPRGQLEPPRSRLRRPRRRHRLLGLARRRWRRSARSGRRRPPRTQPLRSRGLPTSRCSSTQPGGPTHNRWRLRPQFHGTPTPERCAVESVAAAAAPLPLDCPLLLTPTQPDTLMESDLATLSEFGRQLFSRKEAASHNQSLDACMRTALLWARGEDSEMLQVGEKRVQCACPHPCAAPPPRVISHTSTLQWDACASDSFAWYPASSRSSCPSRCTRARRR